MTGSADNAARHLLVYAKGIVMGISDSVPGVSGGTIAVAANIYDRIIYAVRAIDAEALRLLLRGRAMALWKHLDGAFLLLLGFGIVSGVLLSANLILFLIENNPVPLRAFFIGLIAAAIWMLRAETSLRDWRNALPAVTGALLVLLISMASPGQIQPSAPYLFFCGMIAVSAMLLPGLSGAFILLLLGAYQYMLNALITLEAQVLLIFLAGCVVGVMLMSRIVAWLLRNYRQRAYGFICGMLAGSLLALWPWQISGATGDVMQFLANQPVWPGEYFELSGRDPVILISLAALLAGLGLTLLARGPSAPGAADDNSL